MDVCPTSAITWKGSQIFLKENETFTALPTEAVDLTSIDDGENTEKTNTPPAKTKKTKTEKAKRVVKIIVLVLMIALLVGSFVYYNFIDKNPETPTGNEVGNVCVGVDLQIIDGNGETDKTFNPASNKGKITVINFWGTWCGPCVKELPYFDKLASEYGDDVTVVAIHTTLVSQTAPAFIKSTYPDSSVIFALDTKSNPDDITAPDNYYNILGGTGAYPMTIILDENGVITHKFVGSLEEHELFEAVESVIK
jgi:thiol-disulfide isomerase/thioredoxin